MRIAVLLIAFVAIAGLIFLKTAANGFSARSDPSRVETLAATWARKVAMPGDARARTNPITAAPAVIEEGMAHWADHCATCHGNDGKGQVPMGRNMYPHAPDMTQAATQQLTDGELFYIIENGIRMSGMPAWAEGGEHTAEHTEDASWKLVHFIRHLPRLTPQEQARMETLNPKSPDDMQHLTEEEQFLNGGKTK